MRARIRQLGTQFWHWIASRINAIWHKMARVVTSPIEARALGARWIIVWVWRTLKFVGGALALVALGMLLWELDISLAYRRSISGSLGECASL
jgi:hypothetical protein